MAAQPKQLKWVPAVTVSTVLAAAGYLGAVLWAGRSGVIAALERMGAGTAVILLALSLVNYALRFVRWHYYLRLLGARIGVWHDLRIYIGGFALTTTPGKAGELARSLWLRPYGVPASSSVAAFCAERLQDFVVVLGLASLEIALHPHGVWLLTAAFALLAAALAVVLVPAAGRTVLRAASGRAGRIAAVAARLTRVLEETRGCLRPGPLLMGLSLGAVAWGAESLGFSLLLRWLGHPVPAAAAFSIYAFSMLAGAVSFMPGGLGGSEATMVILLKLRGLPSTDAVSATLVIRAATLWFAVLLGILALSLRTRAPPGLARPIAVQDG
jgi:uncharacterized protein (TIRG00374 family)